MPERSRSGPRHVAERIARGSVSAEVSRYWPVERLFRGRLVSFAVLVAASASRPLAILHFFGRDQVQVEAGSTSGPRRRLAGRGRRRAGAHDRRRAPRRRPDRAARHRLLDDDRHARRPRPRDARHPRSARTGVIAFSGAAVLPVGGAVLALSALPALRRPQRGAPAARRSRSCCLAVVGLGLDRDALPRSRAGRARDGQPAGDRVLVVGLVLLRRARGARRAGPTRSRGAAPTWWSWSGWCGSAWRSCRSSCSATCELGWWIGHATGADRRRCWSACRSRSTCTAARSRVRWPATCGRPSWSPPRRRSSGSNVRALHVQAGRTRTPTRSCTPAGSRCARCRSASSSGCRGGRLRSSRSAACCTTSASSRCPTEILQKPGPLDRRGVRR